MSEPALSGIVITPPRPPAAIGRIIAPRTATHPRAGEGSLVRLGSELLYVYGRYEGTGDYAWAELVRRTSPDDGATWSDETPLFRSDHQLALPSLLRLADGTLLLSYVAIADPGSAKRVVRRSVDGARSWSPEIALTDGVRPYMTGSHDRMRRLSNGRLIYPVHAFIGLGEIATFVYVSEDHGATWRRTTDQPLRVPGMVSTSGFQHGFWEAAVSEVAPGQLLMVGRTAMGCLYRSRSDDYGTSWSQAEPMSVAAPTAPPNIVQLPSGRTLLVWESHCDPAGTAGGPRWILSALTSGDAGGTWSHHRQIEYDGQNWFAYPSLYVDADATICLTYYGENDGFGDAKGYGNIFGGSRYLKLASTWFEGE